MHRILLSLIIAVFPLYGKDAFILDDHQDFHPIYAALSVYEDTTGKLEFADILENKNLTFNKRDWKFLSYGLTNSAVWGKFYVSQKDADSQKWFLVNHYSMIDTLDFYLPQKDGSYKRIKSGNRIPFKNRDFKHRYQVFPLDNLHESLPVYFRIQTNDEALDVRMFIASEGRLLRYLENDSFKYGILIGIVLLIIFYNAVIYIVNKDRSYLYYLLYALFYWITQLGLNGYLYQYLFPENYQHAQLLRNICAHAASVFAIFFAIEFMKIQKNFPRFGLYLKILAGLFAANLAITLNIDYVLHNYIFFLLLLIGCISLIASGIISYRIYTYARYYLAAWSFFLLVWIVYTLRIINIAIPHVTTDATSVGGVAEILMLGFALAKRIQSIREEKEKAEFAAIENNFRAQSLAFRNNILEKDLDLARSMQNRMIPDLREEPDMKSIYMPMEKIGGDFFDIMDIGPNTRGIFFGDVTGHGVSAALVTSMIKSSFANETRNTENQDKNREKESNLNDPLATLALLNDSLETYSNQHYLSCAYGILDRPTSTFTFSFANHPPLLYLHQVDGKVILDFISSSPQSPLLGVWSKEKFKTRTIGINSHHLEAGSRLIFASDGFLETIGYDFEFMEKGLASFHHTPVYDLFSNFHRFDNNAFIAELQRILDGILKTSTPADDICILTLNS